MEKELNEYSIVIPVYNKEDYVKKAIHSVLSQTHEFFELILVDDGSTDNSLRIIREIDDSRIRVFSIENSGVSAARNYGIAKSSYEYIAFLDADDWWEKTFLEEINNLILKFKDNAVFASGRSRIYNNRVQRYDNFALPSDGDFGIISYFDVVSRFLPPINSSCTVVKREVFFKVGLFNESLRQHEDHDMWVRMCVNSNIVFINKSLSNYRKNIKNSASTKQYSVADFSAYLDTIFIVKSQLKGKDFKAFRKYYRRFIVLTLILNLTKYSAEDIRYIKRNSMLTYTGYNRLIPFLFLISVLFNKLKWIKLYICQRR